MSSHMEVLGPSHNSSIISVVLINFQGAFQLEVLYKYFFKKILHFN